MKILFFLLLFALSMQQMPGSAYALNANHWNDGTPVYQVLQELGDTLPAHYERQLDTAAVKRGEEIVRFGTTLGPDGERSPIQSNYFVCIDCHNLRREDPVLKISNPEARLDYALQHQLRFLPGTTFHGLVNRESWFNGDYVGKYRDLAIDANKDLLKATQLCAKQCAMGRELNAWELRSVLAYFQSLELKLGDLNLSAADWRKLRQEAYQPLKRQELLAWLKGFYLDASPATFAEPPEKIAAPSEDAADIEKGKAIYVLSCMSCHQPGRVTSFTLANAAVTYSLLHEHSAYSAKFSVYHAIRTGIKASPGKGYMPNFTLERMSNRQIEQLRAFLKYQTTHRPLPLEPYVDWIN